MVSSLRCDEDTPERCMRLPGRSVHSLTLLARLGEPLTVLGLDDAYREDMALEACETK
jgi:hypothetical protein